MKIFLSALFLVIGSWTAQAEPGSYIQTYTFGACDWWQIGSGGYPQLYGCQTHPQRVEVPNASDLIQVLNSYEARIERLEAQIKTLEDVANHR